MLKELGMMVFYYIESSIAVAFIGLAMLGVRPHWKKILAFGVIQGFLIAVIRFSYTFFNLKMGSHIIFTFATGVMVIKHVTKVRWGVATASTFIGIITLMLSEMLLMPVYLNITHSTGNEVFKGFWSHIAISYFTNSLHFLIAIIVGITGFSLFKTERQSLGE